MAKPIPLRQSKPTNCREIHHQHKNYTLTDEDTYDGKYNSTDLQIQIIKIVDNKEYKMIQSNKQSQYL